MTIQVSKTCKIWIPLNPFMFYSSSLGYREMSLSPFLLFWVLVEFSSALSVMIPPLFIVSFQEPRVLLIPLSWVPKPIMYLLPRRLIFSLFLIISSFWWCFFESLWLTFHSKVCLGDSSWFLIFPSFSPFQTQLLIVLSFCHFSQMGRSHSCWVKGFPYYFPL